MSLNHCRVSPAAADAGWSLLYNEALVLWIPVFDTRFITTFLLYLSTK